MGKIILIMLYIVFCIYFRNFISCIKEKAYSIS